MLKRGTQIIYVPQHALGDFNHPDCEKGFITSLGYSSQDAFCRYWRQTPPFGLRTKANSELTPISQLIVQDSVSQEEVEAALKAYCD